MDERRLFVGVELMDGQEKRTVGLAQQADKLEVRASYLRSTVDDHDDGCSFIQRHTRLAEDFCRDEILFFREDATRIDHAKPTATPFCVPVEAIPRDAGLVAHDGTPRTDDTVEERGLAYVRPAYDRDNRNPGRGGVARVVNGLAQVAIIERSEEHTSELQSP